MNEKKEAVFARIKKSDWILIGFSWLSVQIIFLNVMGINNHEEAVKYFSLADNWIHGQGNFHVYNIFYSGFVSIYVLLKWLGLPNNSMYGVQLLLSALSTYYFVMIVRLFIRSRYVIVISGILYATCYLIQQWVSVLFTDSVFCSLLVIATYYLLTLEESKKNKRIFWFLFIILPFFRPVGFLFIMVACVHWIMISFKKNRSKLILSFAYLSIAGIVIYKSFSSEYYFFPIHSMHNILGNVICGYPGNYGKYARVPYVQGMSVFNYLYQNPEMTARLFLSRFYKVFSMSRIYFSPVHNRLLNMSTLHLLRSGYRRNRFCCQATGKSPVFSDGGHTDLFVSHGNILC